MKKKDCFVSIECSRLLKDLCYDGKISGKHVEKIPGTEREEWDDGAFMYVTVTDVVTYPKVHIYDAQSWLMETYNIKVLPRTEIRKDEFRVDIYEGCHCFSPVGWFVSYEDAMRAGINEALKLIQEKEARDERSSLTKDIRRIFEEAERRNNGYHMLPFLSENGDWTNLRTSYDQVVSYADDMRYMLDEILGLLDLYND